MKRKFAVGLLKFAAVATASGQGLYSVGDEAKESLPIKWAVGASAIYDDNVSPGFLDAAGNEVKDSSFALNPYVGVSFVSMTPQTTWDVYARLGLIYYFDAPETMDDLNSQSRMGVNLTHRFSERLRFSSRNFISYELEPDYSYGYASSRSIGEYFYWSTDNSIGFRWSERVATYTGLGLTGTTYPDVDDNDRLTWQLYNQFRYQLSPQTVLTADYRYAQTYGSGVSSDSTDQFILGGVEHRFSPSSIGILRAGLQLRDVDEGDASSSPYVEFALNSQINEKLKVRSFARYGMESYDTVQGFDSDGDGLSNVVVEYSDRETLRFGLSGDYAISPMFTVFAGMDYIPTSYNSGRVITGTHVGSLDQSEDLLDFYVGLSLKFNDFLTGTASYTYTNSSSDIVGREYDRNRISVGVSAEF